MAPFYFFIYAGVGVSTPFLPLWLRGLGFSYGAIGMLAAVSALSGALTQLSLGSLSDRFQRRKPFVVGACLGLAAIFAVYPRAHGFGQFAALYALFGFCSFTANTLASAMVMDLAESDRVARVFARTRSWGSIGFLITTTVLSIIPILGDLSRLFPSACAFNLLAALAAGLAREGTPGRNTTPVRLREGVALLGRPGVLALLVSGGLFWGCLQASTGSLSLLIKSLGGDRSTVSRAFLVAVVAEIPLMWVMGRLSDRIGRRPVLVLASLALPVRLYLYSLAGAAVWVLPIQAFHGLTFSIAAVVPMAFMSDIAPARLRASGQGLLNAVYAGASAVGPLAAGYLSDRVGLSGMYAYLGGAALFAACLTLIGVPETRQGALPVQGLLPRGLRPLAGPLCRLLDGRMVSAKEPGRP